MKAWRVMMGGMAAMRSARSTVSLTKPDQSTSSAV
jgi:hypothetical protein